MRFAWIAVVVVLFRAASAWAGSGERTEILVGSEFDYPPYALVTEDGKADGFTVDLMKAVCEVMGIKVRFRVGPWSEVRAALEKGEVDALPLVSYSAEREKVFDFTAPHTVAYASVFVRKDGPGLDTEDDLRGHRVAVMRADATHDHLVATGFPAAGMVLTHTVPETLRLLSSGEVDYALAPRLVGLLVAHDLGLNNIEPAGPLIDVYGRGYGFAVKEGDSALLAQLNQGLAIVKNTGRYDALYRKWFGVVDPPGVSREDLTHYAAIAGLAAAIVVAAFLVWTATLRGQVTRRTVDLKRAAAERERAQGRFRAVLEKMPIAACLVDAEGTIYFRNDRFLDLFGYTSEDVPTADAWWLHAYPDPDYRAWVVETWEEAVRRSAEEGIDIEPIEYRVTSKDGRVREVEISGIVFGEELLATFIDRTDSNRVKRGLEDLNRRMALAADSAGIGVWDFDLDGQDLVWDDWMYRLFGVARDQVAHPYTTFCETVHPDDLERVHAEIDRAAKGEADFDTAFRIVRPDGAVRHLKANGVIVRDADGRARRMVGINFDITAEMEAQERFRQLFDNMISGVAIYRAVDDGADFVFVDFNEAAEILDKMSRDDLIGRRVTEVFAGVEDFGILDVFRRVWRTGVPEQHPVTLYSDDRISAWRENHVFRLPSGEVVAVYADVSDRKRSEEALLEERARLNEAQRIALLGGWKWDVVRDELTWSDEVFRLFGLEPGAIEPSYERYVAMIHPDDRASFQETTRRIRDGEATYVIDYRVQLPDGGVKDVRERGEATFGEGGTLLSLSGTVQDVSEQKAAEKRLLQIVDELTRSNAELERFAFIVSHDLSEPVRSVVTYTQLLARRLGEPLDDDLEEIVSFITSGARRMNEMVRDILTYSRIERADDAFALVDMGRVLDAALENLDLTIRDSGAEIARGALPVVSGNEGQLVEVLQNLVGNGIKFRLSGEPCRIRIEAERNEGFWRFAVSDNGIGIEPQYFDRIFEIFKRLHTITAYPGTGIGLAVCKRIVERHGGRIWVESTPGKGATFFFTLPAAA